MSSKKKKILSALLASSMIMSQVCVVAYADTYELTIPDSNAIEDATVTVKKVEEGVAGSELSTGTQLNTGDELEITISNVPAEKKPVIKVNDNTLTESDGKYSYTVQEAAVVISVEYLNEYTVTGGSNIVLKKGDAEVASDTKFVKDDVLTIEPAAGYKFSSAPTVGGSAATSNDEGATYTYTFQGTENSGTPGALAIVDNAVKKSAKISFEEGITVDGKTTGDSVNPGDELTITAGEKAEDKQVAVKVGDADATADEEDKDNYKFTYTIPATITDGGTLAIVATESYKVTYESTDATVTDGESKTVTSGTFVAKETNLTITAIDKTGYNAAVKVNGSEFTSGTTHQVVGAVTVAVEYTPIDISLVTTSAQSDKVDITVTRGESPLEELPENVQVGDKITFAAKPESNVVIKSVSVNGTSLAKIEDGYTVKGDEENVTIVVEVQNAYKINVANMPENVVLKKGSQEIDGNTIFVKDDVLKIEPASGYEFEEAPTVGGTNATESTGGAYTYTFTGSEDNSAALEVSATAVESQTPAPAKYAVTITGEGLTVTYGSEQSVTSGDELEDGTALTITAAEKKGYTAKIKVNGTDNEGSFTINGAAVSISVEYVAKDIALTPSGEGKDNVTITVTRGEGEGAQTISDLNKLNVGDVITFAPKTGYSITKITVGEAQDDVKEGYTVVGDDEGGITLNITTAKVFTVGDAPANTKLYKGENEVTSTTTFAVDETLTIKPETGYKFTAAPTVGGNTATAGENGEYTYKFTDSDTSTSALTVSATAKKVSKIASITDSDYAEITVKKGGEEVKAGDEVLEGDELTITVTPCLDSKLKRVVINGKAYSPAESYTYTVGTSDVTIEAEIAAVYTYKIVGLKDTYFVGVTQEEALAGLELTVTYDDGSVEYHVPISKAKISEFSTENNKLYYVVTYGLVSGPVEIDLTAVAVEKIAVTTDFQRQYTTSDESLVLTGGKLTVYKNNGETEEINIADNENVSVEGYAHDKAYANLDLTITYTVDENHKYTTTYSIVVLDASKTVSGIVIADENELKKEYYVGDEFVVGGQITVSYSDADSETIDITSAMVSGYNPQTSGSQTITVTYGGKTTSYEVTVTAVTVTGITVTPPTKTDYKVGESLDLTGGSLVATYNNGKEETLPLTAAGVSVTGFNSSTTGEKTINVSYNGKSGSFKVNVAEKSYKVNFSNATVKNGETELKTGDSVAENTVLTVTAAPKDGYTAALKVNGTAQSGTSATITVINDVTITVEYTKKSSGGSSGGSGGSSGGSSSGGSSSTTKNPTVDGKTQTWTDVASDISKLTDGTAKTINLNGGTTVPVDVVKAIATSNAEVTLEVDEVFSWTIDGSDIDPKDAKAADLSITKTTVTGTSALRGTVGTGFTIKGTNVKSELNINFKATHAGEFANLFKKVDGKLVFVDNVKVDKNGAAIGLEVSEKGEYVVMLGKYSDRAGDMDNDGISNAKDSLAILKDFLDMEKGVNPLVADVNGDGFINAKDALQVLIEYLGIK